MNHLRKFLVLVFLIIQLGCTSKKEAIYLLPEGFTGVVIILFEQPDGINLPVEDGYNVYKIPADGVLKVKTSPIRKIHNEKFFYEKENGERVKIDYLYPKGRGTTWEENPKTFNQIQPDDPTIFAMGREFGTFNIKNEVTLYRIFKIGKMADSEKLSAQSRDKIFEIQGQKMN